jgi:hypothetical protein
MNLEDFYRARDATPGGQFHSVIPGSAFRAAPE